MNYVMMHYKCKLNKETYDIMTCSGSAEAITLAIYSILTPTKLNQEDS
jgi:hypothetical protein